MALIPVLALIAIIVGVCRRWGASALWFVAAGMNFIGAFGVVAEHLWGPQVVNLGHHGLDYSGRAAVQGLCFVAAGVAVRTRGKRLSQSR
jgi:hypothetical protein